MTERPDSTQEWWLGYLAGNVREALREPTTNARARLKETLERFTASPACDPQLRQALGAKPRPRAAALNDGYDLSENYKPCGNPECRAPLPKRDKRTYCDRLCKAIAGEYAADQEQAEHDAGFRAANPNYDEIPY